MSTSKKSILRTTGAWWALSGTRARMTVIGAAAIVLALATTSAFVWVSPTNPVAQIIKSASAVSAEQAQAARTVKERNSLLSQVLALQKQLAASKGGLATTKTQLASIQQQLWSTQGQLDALQKSSAAAAAAAAASKIAVKKPTKASAPVASIVAPTKAQIVNPSSRYFGLFTQQAPFNYATYDSTATAIGSAPNSVGYFGGWDQSYRGDVVRSAWKRNTLPVLTWESRPIDGGNSSNTEADYTLPKIIGGAFDAYLHQYAKDIVSTGLPLGIRLDHEMNGVWYPWDETDGKGASINSNSVGDYVKMWQHVHDVFQQEGANSLVVWIWAPNIVNNLPATHKSPAFLAGLYPGDGNVDLVGLSGYLRPPYVPANDFTFDYSFGQSLSQLRSLTSKPIFLAEVGASETGGHKSAWITSFFAALSQPENSDIIGFSWFNLAVTSYTEGVLQTNDWRIDSRPESLAAFTAGLALPGSNFRLSPK